MEHEQKYTEYTEHAHFQKVNIERECRNQTRLNPESRILVSDLLYRTLSRHQHTLFMELGKHSQRTVGQHHLVWRHLR